MDTSGFEELERAKSEVSAEFVADCPVEFCVAYSEWKDESHEDGEEDVATVETGGEMSEAGMAVVKLRVNGGHGPGQGN